MRQSEKSCDFLIIEYVKIFQIMRLLPNVSIPRKLLTLEKKLARKKDLRINFNYIWVF